jgi:hypothetical protein
MAKAKGMTYAELMEYARAHYASGGDGVFECWDERTFDDYVRDCGEMTKRKALQLFRLYKETTDDEMGW